MIEEILFFFDSIDSVVHSIVFAVLLAPATGRSILTIKSILFYTAPVFGLLVTLAQLGSFVFACRCRVDKEKIEQKPGGRQKIMVRLLFGKAN